MSHELFFPCQVSTIHVRHAHETVAWPTIAAQTGPIVRHDDLLMTQQVLTFNTLDAWDIDETQKTWSRPYKHSIPLTSTKRKRLGQGRIAME
jgi:hypothetical protein